MYTDRGPRTYGRLYRRLETIDRIEEMFDGTRTKYWRVKENL